MRFCSAASGDERKRWLGYKRTLDGAVITTIHGFCARLLREFPVEARSRSADSYCSMNTERPCCWSRSSRALSYFISSGHVEISRLTLGVGRARLASCPGPTLSRGTRPGSLVDRARNEDRKQPFGLKRIMPSLLADLYRAMNDFLRVSAGNPAAK